MAKKFYGVKAGHKPGVYSYEEAKKQVDGFSAADWKGFNNYDKAAEYAGIQEKGKKKGKKNDTVGHVGAGQVAAPVGTQLTVREKQERALTEAKLKDTAMRKAEAEIVVIKEALNRAQTALAANPHDSEASAELDKQTQLLDQTQFKVDILSSSIIQSHNRGFEETYYISGNKVYDDIDYAMKQSIEGNLFIAHNLDGVAEAMRDRGYTSWQEMFRQDLRYINSKGEEIYQVFINGGCSREGTSAAIAGYGAYFGQHNPKNGGGPLLENPQTSQRAELAAVVYVYKIISFPADHNKYEIYASEYVVNSLVLMARIWEMNGWKTETGGPVPNRDLIEQIIDLHQGLAGRVEMQRLQPSGRDAYEEADKLAAKGIEMNRDVKRGLLRRVPR